MGSPNTTAPPEFPSSSWLDNVYDICNRLLCPGNAGLVLTSRGKRHPHRKRCKACRRRRAFPRLTLLMIS